MVRESVSELQALVNTDTVERRHNTRIPMDRGNIRVLRQSITYYLGQASQIQEEIVSLEKTVDELRSLVSALPECAPFGDGNMQQVESYMRSVGRLVNKIKSLLRYIEPRGESGEYQTTLERKTSRTSIRYTQYHALSLMIYAAISSYKEILDTYAMKLEGDSESGSEKLGSTSTSDNAADKVDEPVGSSLLHADIISSAVKVKQRMMRREHDVAAREQRIRTQHRQLSSTMELYDTWSDDESPDSWSHVSSPMICDMETGLFSSYISTSASSYHKRVDNQRQKTPFSLRHCLIAAVIVTLCASALLTAVSLSLHYSGHFSSIASDDRTVAANRTSTPVNYTQPVLSDNTTNQYGDHEQSHASEDGGKDKTSEVSNSTEVSEIVAQHSNTTNSDISSDPSIPSTTAIVYDDYSSTSITETDNSELPHTSTATATDSTNGTDSTTGADSITAEEEADTPMVVDISASTNQTAEMLFEPGYNNTKGRVNYTDTLSEIEQQTAVYELNTEP